MKFRLYYDGPLLSSQKDPVGNQQDRRAQHKHEIRQAIHKQLKHMWQVEPAFRDSKKYLGDNRYIDAFDGRESPEMPLSEHIAEKHNENGFRFLPLIRKDWDILCELHVLLLRRDPPGSALDAGDIDNRMKTLIDGLRKPHSLQELAGNAPEAGEDPFYCLLEDDKLVTKFTVETDRLYDGAYDIKIEDARYVRAIITVEAQPLATATFRAALQSESHGW